MDIPVLKNFISDGFDRWGLIKRDFSGNDELSAYLKRASLVILFDHHQLDIDFARNLDKPALDDKKNPKPEELAREDFRRKMASYLKNDLRELFMEVRFPHIEIDLIQDLKVHPAIKGINNVSPAVIRVVVLVNDIRNQEGLCS